MRTIDALFYESRLCNSSVLGTIVDIEHARFAQDINIQMVLTNVLCREIHPNLNLTERFSG